MCVNAEDANLNSQTFMICVKKVKRNSSEEEVDITGIAPANFSRKNVSQTSILTLNNIQCSLEDDVVCVKICLMKTGHAGIKE